MGIGGDGGTKRCPQCGATLPAPSEVCARCGHAWADTPVGAVIARVQRRLRWRLVALIVVFVLVAIFLYASIFASA